MAKQSEIWNEWLCYKRNGSMRSKIVKSSNGIIRIDAGVKSSK